MNQTLGKRIGALRREKGLKQDELAEKLGISPQAVSKWETDQTCPDISLLPTLAKILGVSVDELLSGKQESAPAVRMLPEAERKDIGDMMLRVVMTSADGDSLRVNWAQIFELVKRGAIGNLVDAESSDGDVMQIFVE